jgi:hypothetical protein
MANKNILLVMLAITLLFGLTLTGCDKDPDAEYDKNFKGVWSGTFTPKDGEEIEATIEFKDTTWILKAGTTINYNGTYDQSSNYTATLKMLSLPFGIADFNPLNNTLTVRITTVLETGTGSFTGNQSNPFNGTWNGTYKEVGEDEVAATITFTDNTWTMRAGTTNNSGDYTRSDIGFTATFTSQGIPFGTAICNPVTGNITGTIGLGKVDFTRAP